MVQNRAVGLLHKSGSSTAPIVVSGRTITLRAQTWALPVKFGDMQMWLVHARPHHVEVLEPDGRHHTMRVRDVTFGTRLAIAAASAIGVAAARHRRHRKRSDG
jgi:hypothetical protein